MKKSKVLQNLLLNLKK